MKNLTFLFLITIFFICSSSKCNNGATNSSSSCLNEDNLALESTCFSATVLKQGNPFPNPVGVGSTLSLSMKIAVIGSPLALLPANISTKIFAYGTGQLVGQFNVGTVQSSNTYQNVPVWTNINVASGYYYIEVTADAGPCGSKTICLKDFKISVIR
jgi:hypothetical protein